MTSKHSDLNASLRPIVDELTKRMDTAEDAAQVVGDALVRAYKAGFYNGVKTSIGATNEDKTTT